MRGEDHMRQVFGPERPAAARAAIAELERARAAHDPLMHALRESEHTRATLARLRAAQEARAMYWEYGDSCNS